MDKLVSRIEELFSFLADVATVWFVIRSLSGLTLRQMIARLVRRNTVITPLTGTLRATGGRLVLKNAFDTVNLGGSASTSATLA